MTRTLATALAALTLLAEPAISAPAAPAADLRAQTYPQDYELQIRAYLEDTLKDYGSAIIKWDRPPRAGLFVLDDRLFGKKQPAYLVCYRVNAKNSYGGYVGFRTHLSAFHDGRLVHTWSLDGPITGRPQDASDVSRECEKPADPPPPGEPPNA